MNEEKEYAEQWDVSAKFFYEQGYYSWMAQQVEEMETVVEIGCGTGYSTLVLIENGHKVIAIEKNHNCIVKAKQLLIDNEITDDKVIFIEGDIVEDSFRDKIAQNYEFDAVLCWNIGSYWNKEMRGYYLPYMLQYGLNIWQIEQNPGGSYAELILWEACRLAQTRGVAVHIVDRGAEILNEQNDPYYKMLKDEFHYKEIEYANHSALSRSEGGCMLSFKGEIKKEKVLDIILVSVLMR